MHLVPPKDPPVQCVMDLITLIRSGEAVEKKDWVFIHSLTIGAYAGRVTFGVPPEVDAGVAVVGDAQPATHAELLAACRDLQSAIVETVPPEGVKQGVLDGVWKYLYELVLPKLLELIDFLTKEIMPA